MALGRCRPSGLLRLLANAPLCLYRLNLAWLLGHRFVRIAHRGRRSGRIRRTVVEVARYEPGTGRVVVASAWGGRTDWYRSIQAEAALEIRIGSSRYRPRQRFLSAEETYNELMGYFRRHRLMARALQAALLGLGPETPVPPLRSCIDEIFRGVEFRPPPC